jgi:hypothetical protein
LKIQTPNDSIFLEARDASGRSDAAGAETGNFTVAVGRPIKDETEYRQVCVSSMPVRVVFLGSAGIEVLWPLNISIR